MDNSINLNVNMSIETAKLILDVIEHANINDMSIQEKADLFLFAVYLKKLIDKTETTNSDGIDVIEGEYKKELESLEEQIYEEWSERIKKCIKMVTFR